MADRVHGAATDAEAPRRVRVGILTYHFSDNFGAIYQAYGLRKWFRDRGCEAEFINYHPQHVEEGAPLRWGLSARAFRANLKNLFLHAMGLRRRLLGNREQARAFAAFRRDVLGVRGDRLQTLAAVEASLPPLDLIVCGSDQIWNPSIQFGIDPVYFGGFATRQPVRRIAYAASFGRDSLEAAYREEVRINLERLDAVSVREESGVRIVKEVAGRDAVCVPDPTLLVGGFDDLLRGVPQNGSACLFCYALRSATGIREVAHLAADSLGLSILSPYNPYRRWPEIGKTVFPSPIEWLATLRDARFVVTNSFHGVALSLVLRKEFVAVGLAGGKQDLNERVLNLLAQAGLDERFVADATEAALVAPWRSPIDWQAVDARLEGMRRAGSAFLIDQLALLPAH